MIISLSKGGPHASRGGGWILADRKPTKLSVSHCKNGESYILGPALTKKRPYKRLMNVTGLHNGGIRAAAKLMIYRRPDLLNRFDFI